MTTLKGRILSAVAAAAIAISPFTAQASWLDPNDGDILFAVDHILVEASQLLAIGKVKASNIKVVYLEEILTGDELVDVVTDLQNPVTQIEIITLKNTLNNAQVLNGSDITTLQDFLNGNDIDANDVVALEVFRDGRVLLFSCGESCD